MAVTLTILHYHLRRGGVTTVIGNEQRALSTKFDMRVLADFGYNEKPARNRAQFTAEARALMKRLPRTGVLHTHNIALGKNPRLAYAVKLLAQQTSIRVINQIHDFPEDNRPAQLHALRYCTGRRDEFWREFCYYELPNVIWATLTIHDAARLAARGVPVGKIHVLPNPVNDRLFAQPASSRAATLKKLAQYAREHRFLFNSHRPVLLSPMKVMVRKNNEEAVELIKRLKKYQLVISLDASSRSDRAYSERLKRKIRRERLPVVIGAGQVFKNPLPLFDIAHAILTTSKAEGFGYVFIEGWLRRKLVIGRDLRNVTRDFIAAGMDLGHLYREFDEDAIQRIAELLALPSRELVDHNRRVVMREYSLRAYARRFAALSAQIPLPT